MELDDGSRSKFGVVVSLVEVADGTTRIVLDDVRSEVGTRDTSWTFDSFYTHKRLDSAALAAMTLPDDEYQGLAISLIARLLALKEARTPLNDAT